MRTIQKVLLGLIVIGLALIVTQQLWVPPLVSWLITKMPPEDVKLVIVPMHTVVSKDPKDATYVIDGMPVSLVNGKAEVASAPGSASKTTTTYFGNEAVGDLNGDGLPDTALILTQSSGGSGTFYFAAVALKTKDGYVGTNAVLLGDRVAPQATEVKNGEAIFNFADRKASEPMTAQPSEAKSKYLKVENDKLVEASKSN
jgi:hypothetical protein